MKKEKRTGAKKAIKTIAALVLAGGIVAVGITGAIKLSNNSSSRAKSLVEDYTVSDSLQIPKEVTVTQTEDTTYCEGKDLQKAINKAGIKYCQFLDEYYTPDGREIAVITVTGNYTETIDAKCVEIDGQKIYMAPVGYELVGDKACRTIRQTYTKIIDKQDDYSNIQVTGLDDVEISIEEHQTRSYKALVDYRLVVDVPEGAVLDENNECSATFTLVTGK